MKEFIKKNKLLVMVLILYGILMLVARDKAIEAFKTTGYYVIEMLQIMPMIFLLTALIEAWVPKELIIRSFGDTSGIKGTFFSFLLGSISAGPIYAAFPISKMLLKKGASINNIVIILSAWAVIKIPMLANEAKFLGPKFMIIRWILTTISILIMSYIVAFLVKKEEIPQSVKEKALGEISIKHQCCTGCGVCVRLYPQDFKLANGKAQLVRTREGTMESIREAVDKCPVRAISAE